MDRLGPSRYAVFMKKRIADAVIFVGMAVNAVVIVLILYYFVL